ncbi:Acyltransferase, partial [Ancylostoma duodenale]
RLSPAPYKHLPVYPLLSPAVNLAYSNHPRLRVSCTNCFPQPLPDFHQNYVDLLEFSKFGGIPYPILPGAHSPSPWFADLRYSLATPLPHSYPRVYEEVVTSDRVNAVVKAEQTVNPSVSQYEIKRKVSRFYYEIRATLSRFICKICGYLLFKVFRRLMTRLLVCPQQMKRLVDAEKTVVQTIVNAVVKAEQTVNPSVSQYEINRKVSRFYYEIRATLSRFICKICGYLLFKVFRRLMTRLLVCPQQMKRLVDAEKTGTPLVYLPLHRSHLDYLLITWTSWHFGLRLPHIAAGDNLNLNGLGWLLRATGAFFIRRRVDERDEGGKDAVYRLALSCSSFVHRTTSEERTANRVLLRRHKV